MANTKSPASLGKNPWIAILDGTLARSSSPRPGAGFQPALASEPVDSLFLAGQPRQSAFFRALKAIAKAELQTLKDEYVTPALDTVEELWSSQIVDNLRPIQEECHSDTPFSCAGTFVLHAGVMTIAVVTWEDTLLISAIKGKITRLKKEKVLTEEEAKTWGDRVDILFIAKDIGNFLKSDLKYVKELEPLEGTKLTKAGVPNKTTRLGKEYFKTQAENVKTVREDLKDIAQEVVVEGTKKLDEKKEPSPPIVHSRPGRLQVTIHPMTPSERARYEAEKAAKVGNARN